MSSSIPDPIQLNPVANSNRIYLILGLFVVIMIIIFKVFFEDKIRELILGDIYIKPKSEGPSQFEEVYNVGNNIYTYDEAQQVCNTLNAKLFSFQKKIQETKITKPPT